MLAPSFLLGCVWMFTLKGGIGNWNLPPSILPFGRPGIRKQNCLRIPIGIRLPCAHLPPIRSLHARYCLAFARVSIPRKAATLSSSWRQPPPSPSQRRPPSPYPAAVLRIHPRRPSSIVLPSGSPPPSRSPTAVPHLPPGGRSALSNRQVDGHESNSSCCPAPCIHQRATPCPVFTGGKGPCASPCRLPRLVACCLPRQVARGPRLSRCPVPLHAFAFLVRGLGGPPPRNARRRLVGAPSGTCVRTSEHEWWYSLVPSIPSGKFIYIQTMILVL
jgi:hypothetical protein